MTNSYKLRRPTASVHRAETLPRSKAKVAASGIVKLAENYQTSRTSSAAMGRSLADTALLAGVSLPRQ